MNRYQAALIHLAVSACLLGLAYLFVANIWYPGPLFMAAAGGDLMKLLVSVDVILGPLIMLIIFAPEKKLIKFDVAVIVLCQAVFLGYGMWSIYSARPVYIAFVESRYFLVRANDIDDVDLAKASNPLFKSLPKFGPIYVGTKEPADPKIRQDILFSGLSGMGIQNLPQYFIPYTDVQRQVLLVGKSSQDLKGISMETRVVLQKIEQRRVTSPVLFLMLVNKQIPLIAVIDAKTGAVIELV